MMEVTQELNRLFDAWEAGYPPYQGCFKRDGIVDEKGYLEQTTKVLFIAKEPNDPSQGTGDFRKWWREHGLQYTFSIRLAEWAYGMLHNFPRYRDAYESHVMKHEALLSVAFMNIKKSGGEGMANNAEIDRVALETQEFLRRQINLIDPDIVIGSLMGCDGAWEAIFPDAHWTNHDNYVFVTRVGKMRVIEFFHPSNRFPTVMNYTLLKEVINSQEFRAL
jgi:hypothetical protein